MISGCSWTGPRPGAQKNNDYMNHANGVRAGNWECHNLNLPGEYLLGKRQKTDLGTLTTAPASLRSRRAHSVSVPSARSCVPAFPRYCRSLLSALLLAKETWSCSSTGGGGQARACCGISGGIGIRQHAQLGSGLWSYKSHTLTALVR